MADTLFVDATTTVNGTPIIAAWMNDVNTNTYTILSAVAGTNAITGNAASTVTVGYPRGVAFRFIPINNNTAAVTINISGLGVRNLTKFGTDTLVANDLRAGMWAYIAYDGVQFQLINPRTTDFLFPTGTLPVTNGGTGATTGTQALINLGATGRLINVQTFTANGTYTPTAGMNFVIVDAVGGGGAGGGAAVTGVGQAAVGAGGSSGGRTVGRFVSPGSQAVTIGAAGVAVSGAGGGAGATTSFGALLTALGGLGGPISLAGALVVTNGVDGATASGTGGNILAVQGEGTDPCLGNNATSIFSSGGGASPLGGKVRGQSSGGTGVAGITATAYGAGGSGAANNASQAARAGGNGAPGILVVYEYS